MALPLEEGKEAFADLGTALCVVGRGRGKTFMSVSRGCSAKIPHTGACTAYTRTHPDLTILTAGELRGGAAADELADAAKTRPAQCGGHKEGDGGQVGVEVQFGSESAEDGEVCE